MDYVRGCRFSSIITRILHTFHSATIHLFLILAFRTLVKQNTCLFYVYGSVHR